MSEQSKDFTNPLPQKSDYNLEDHLIYGRQKGWKKIIEWVLTILGWAIMLSYVGYIIYGSLAIHYGWFLPEFKVYTREMVLEIQEYFYILFIAMLIICVLLIFWKNYNKQKFGKLHRRKFRPDVEDEELAEMFEIDLETVKRMQSQRVVVLETNIVPEHLGMGGKNPNAETYEDEMEAQRKKDFNL